MYIKDIPLNEFSEIIKTSDSVVDALKKCKLNCIGGAARKTLFNRCYTENLHKELDELRIRVFNTAKFKNKSNKTGISDRAIAKHCKLRNISQPDRGYWRKKETGKL